MTSVYKAFIKAFDLRVFVAEHFNYVKANRELLINCIYHADDTPSLSVSKEVFYCHGCGKAGDSVRFLCDAMHKQPHEVIKDQNVTSLDYYRDAPPERPKSFQSPKEEIIAAAKKQLWRNTDKLQYLRSLGLKLSTIHDADLGYYGYPTRRYRKPRFVIPIRDAGGNLISARYRRDDTFGTDEAKYLVYPNSKHILYNTNKVNESDNLLLVGSQIDALLLWQEGIPAIGPASENIFKTEWKEQLSGKLAVWYDNDDAGRIGSKKIAEMVPGTKVINWPQGLPKGYDIGDAYREYGVSWLEDIYLRTLES